MTYATWVLLHPRMTIEALGLLPYWLNTNDPRGAADQFDAHYQFGGFKQHPIKGFKAEGYSLKYPGDPVLEPLAMARIREEVVCFYSAEILAVFQPDGSFIAARFD